MCEITPSFCVTNNLVIEQEWIDYNGHLNMAFYTVLFDRSSDDVFAAMGLGANYVKTRRLSCYTVECKIRYLREIRLGDAINATFQLIDHDTKRIKAAQQIFHQDGTVAATAEVLWLHVDPTGEKPNVVPFPKDIKANLDALAKEHNALEIPDFVGKPVGVRS